MDLSEIKLALSLPEEHFRLKIVILDNVLELFMFNFIREKSFDEWHHIDGNANPKKRLLLFSNFYDKQKYCVEKGVFDETMGLFLNVFHELRNSAYHQAFENITTSNTSSTYDVNLHIEYHERMRTIYKELTRLYGVILLDLLNISEENAYLKNYLLQNQGQKGKICNVLTNNLLFRVEKIKKDLKFIDFFSDNEKEKNDLHRHQEMINHITFNYGHEIIEKSALRYKTKMRTMKIMHDNDDFVDIDDLQENDVLFTTQQILDWENSIKDVANASTYLLSVINWEKINKEMCIFEEIIEYYTYCAC